MNTAGEVSEEQSPAISPALGRHADENRRSQAKICTKLFYSPQSAVPPAAKSPEYGGSACAKIATMFPSAVSLPITVGFHTALDTLSAKRDANQAAKLPTVSAAHHLSAAFHAEGLFENEYISGEKSLKAR